MSGTLRSTLDVFDEYVDAEIVRLLLCYTIPDADSWWQFEALRRVHLIPSGDTPVDDPETLNANVFRNLDFVVTEEGENFSTGYDMYLLCRSFLCLRMDVGRNNCYAWRVPS